MTPLSDLIRALVRIDPASTLDRNTLVGLLAQIGDSLCFTAKEAAHCVDDLLATGRLVVSGDGLAWVEEADPIAEARAEFRAASEAFDALIALSDDERAALPVYPGKRVGERLIAARDAWLALGKETP